ncbi:MAG: GTP-binding protein [Clostridiales bacterium]|nr:GTP-binding protein [Candidatus Equinaster intestinalis]
MTKIDIFSGFLGAGKTTLIKKLIKEAFAGEKLVLIENEFGEIGIDGGFLKEAGINITEMNSGCICCSLVGDFGEALKKVLNEYSPDRILIEPSGVGKLSDVIKAVQNLGIEGVELNSFTTVADASKCKMYMKNFGEFYNNQVEFANSVVLSRTDGMSDEKIAAVLELLREKNPNATIITTPWDNIDGKKILDAMEHKNTLAAELALLEEEDVCPECGHHHHHGEECHHDHDEEEHEHHHHHEDEDEHEHEHEHHHHHHDHEEGEECCCGHHHDHGHDHEHEHHHHHHHADEVFVSVGYETANKYTLSEIEGILTSLNDREKYGDILRAKGIVAAEDSNWIHFDFVPQENNVRLGSAEVIGRICVIGSKINEQEIKKLFKI